MRVNVVGIGPLDVPDGTPEEMGKYIKAVYERRQARLAEQEKAREAYATSGMGPLDKFNVGVGRGMANVVDHLGRLVGKNPGLVEEDSKYLMNSLPAKAGNLAGETVATLPLSLGAGGLAARAAGGAGSLVGKAAQWAAEGAAPGALMDEQNRLRGGLGGAVVGVGVPVVGKGLAGAATGLAAPVRGSAQEALQQAGVDLTPGQARPGSVFHSMEGVASHFPVVGPRVKAAWEGAQQGWRELAQDVGSPVGYQAARGQDVRARNADIKGEFNRQYDAAVAGQQVYPSPPVGPGGKWMPMKDVFDDLILGTPGMTDRARSHAASTFNEILSALPQNKKGMAVRVDANLIQQMRSKLRDAANSVANSSELEARPLREIYTKAQQALGGILDAQLPPQNAAAIRSLDAQYAPFMRVVEATNQAAPVTGGAFTPQQLGRSAIGSARGPLNKATGRLSKGNQNQMDVAEAGWETFKPPDPDTGVKSLTMGALSGLGAAVGGLAGHPVAGAGVAATGIPTLAGAAASSPAARRFLTGANPWQQSTRGFLDDVTKNQMLIDILRASAASGGSVGLNE